MGARVVRISTAIYPRSAIELALRAFEGEVIVDRSEQAREGQWEELELSLTQRPDAPENAIDELLATMLRAALNLHLMRTVEQADFPRGL